MEYNEEIVTELGYHTKILAKNLEKSETRGNFIFLTVCCEFHRLADVLVSGDFNRFATVWSPAVTIRYIGCENIEIMLVLKNVITRIIIIKSQNMTWNKWKKIFGALFLIPKGN